jgi:hypothetical protein
MPHKFIQITDRLDLQRQQQAAVGTCLEKPQAQPVQSKGAVVLAIEQVMATQSQEEIKRDFLWQKTKGEEKKGEFKNELLSSYSLDIKLVRGLETLRDQ